MRETKEQIALTLEHAGEALQFPAGVIQGIPGHLVYNVQDFSSIYDLNKQDFDFQVSNEEFTAIGGSVRNSFLYTLLNKSYRFEIDTIVDDLTGWMQLTTNLVEIIDV